VNATRAQWAVLGAATLALTMMTVDVAIVRVALPTIQAELDTSDVAQQWIVNAYLLTMGTFAIVGGRAGDRFGRRRVFMIGVVIFIGCSVLCGISSSSGMLIAARAGQGIGAAIMTPGNIAMVTDAFSGAALGKAMGILVGIGSIGVSMGALVGGALIDSVGWESIFFINVPISLIVLLLVSISVKEHREREAPGLDIPGLVSLTIGMTALTVAVMQAPVWEISSDKTLAAFAIAAVALAVWFAIESRASDPLVDLAVIRGPMLGANVVAFCVPFVLSGLAVLLAIYLQNVLGYSALETGLLMLPMTVPGMLGSLSSGWLLAHLGARVVVSGGMLLTAVGAYAVGVGASADDYGALIPGLVVFSFFASVALPAMTTTLMGGVKADERGMVSGVYNTARLIGATLGLAVMGALLAAIEQQKLDDELAAHQIDRVEETHIHNILAGGSRQQELESLPDKEQAQVEADLTTVFDDAFSATIKLSSLVALFGALVAYSVVPRLRAPPTRDQLAAQPLLSDA
jgi:EmrB/QacA subfamily drug resistance transporter